MNAQTEQDLNEDILQITMVIEYTFPELSKYIGEMPVRISESSDHVMDLNHLKDYYDSLATLLENYASYQTQHDSQHTEDIQISPAPLSDKQISTDLK